MTCGLAVPRQNGKNAVLEIRELYGAVGLGERILHTAHEVKTAQKHFRRLKHFFGQKVEDPGALYPELNAQVQQIRSVNGQEAILLKNGGSIEIVARSKNSGRGFTVDVLVMDEAQELDDDALEALTPTTAAAPLGNPQWIFTGTPPGPNANGEVFTRVRREALGAKPGRLSWHEWSVAHGADLDDRTNWRMTNPALDAGRLQMSVIEGERSRFSNDGFARERLGRWAEDAGAGGAFDAEAWAATATSEPPATGVRSIGVAFSIDGARVSTAGAIRNGDRVHLELIGSRSGSLEAGVGALASWLADRWRDTAMIAICGNAGAATLRTALTDRGVPARVIHVLTSGDFFAANAMTDDAVRAGTVTHPAADEGDALEASVAATKRHTRGANGQWGWKARDGADETPVEALCVANWAARTTKRVPGRKQVIA